MDELVVVATFNSPLEANLAKNRLETEGIVAFLDGEASATMAWPWNARGTAVKLQVARHDAQQAATLLAQLPSRPEDSEDAESDTTLHCLACGAVIGEAPACPMCGWSYDVGPEAASDADADAEISDDDEIEADELDPATLQLSPAGPAVWWEVGAVVAVGVFLPLVQSVYFTLQPLPAPPYWLYTVTFILLCACPIYVTLYLIHRSGESWAQFGLTRVKAWDVPLGLGLFLLADALWPLCYYLMPPDIESRSGDFFTQLSSPTDYALMVLMNAANGYSEELVTRAYLVTRLQQLLRYRSVAVLLSAALFASYHCYQGVPGVAYAMVFGIAYGTAFLLLRRVWPLAIGHMLYNIHLDLAG
jgi:membrane protease YdiL (CAAX protease family)